MTRINDKANLIPELARERTKLIIAIEQEISEVVRADQGVSPEANTKFSKNVLKNSILLVIALGGSQYFWLCYWKDGSGGSYVYDEDDFPKLRDCNRSTDDKEVAKIVGLSDSKFLYTEKVERRWIINTTYSRLP